MKWAIAVFPGSSAQDVYDALQSMQQDATLLRHDEEADLAAFDAFILPGGFSYGDYLRPGAIAARTPLMRSVRRAAEAGMPVLGIGNGFQVLCEAGLLPGGLLVNKSRQFCCTSVNVRVDNVTTPFTRTCRTGQILRLPIAHGSGCYVAPPEQLEQLEREGRIVLRYCNTDGQVDETSNPSGSLLHIAGICNEAGNVVGMMVRPERAVEQLLGNGEDGQVLFATAEAAIAGGGQ